MKLPFTIGYEMTGLVPNYAEHMVKDMFGEELIEVVPDADSLNEALSLVIAAKLKEKYPKNFNVEYYTDGHCIEFPSPVFNTTEAADKFFRTVKREFDAHKITAHNPVTVCGGHHWHFGISNKKTIRNIFRDFAMRPYIPWIFTQPDDTESCNNWITVDLTNNSFASPIVKTMYRIFHGNDGKDLKELNFTELDGDKGRCLVTNLPNQYNLKLPEAKRYVRTLEFRCAEAPRDYEEYKAQRDFFIAYVKYASTLTKVKPCKFITVSELQAITPAECIHKFNLLLKILKLNPRRYHKLIRRNLYPRWKLNRERM